MQLILDTANFLSRALPTCLGNSLALTKIDSLTKIQSAENLPTISTMGGLNSVGEESYTNK